MSKKLRIIIFILFILNFFFLIILSIFYKIEEDNFKKETNFGITFSKKRAGDLGLNWQKTYLAILDELKVKKIRISAYWNEIEEEKSKYNFSSLDWQINEAKNRGLEIILAIGQRLPGWPECHLPTWTNTLSKSEKNQSLMDFISKTIKRYQNNSAIKFWQIENEPFLSSFGVCPVFDEAFFKQEVLLARSLDKRQIIVTESGELSSWLKAAKMSDVLGITMYRIVWNSYIKYFIYPYPAASYFLKGELVKKISGVKNIICVELQTEPWASKNLKDVPLDDQYHIMDLNKIKDVVNFARRAGFSDYYLWGAEWWYWLKQNGDSSIWNYMKTLM